MQQDTETTLDVIYENWRVYNEKLRSAIAQLDQLPGAPAAPAAGSH